MLKIDHKNQEWVRNFYAVHRRSPRLLHISNIANNAYNNAKILNMAGLENHVIAPNDYYAMGCPEWEDADFTAEIQNIWKPDWSHMDLNLFTRPHWFAQGELKTCVDYLIALCQKDEANARLLFQMLSKQNATFNIDGNDLKSNLIYHCRLWLTRTIDLHYHKWRTGIRNFISWIDLKLNTSFRDKIRALLRRVRSYKLHWFGRHRWEIDQKLIADFKAEFPERLDQLSENDFIPYQVARIHFRRLMQHYDIVIGYATEGIYPLMCGIPYFCYEHGTLRDIPYAPDAQGRICSIAYRKARHVFVTNFDCIKSAGFLAPGRFSAINHAYDEDQPLHIAHDWEEHRIRYMRKLEAEMLLFHPTRHDWIEGKGYADKANDVFLNAFAASRKKGLKFGLICCDWGHNVSESKALIAELGMAPYVQWVKPLGIVAYTRMCKAAHMVVDQFKIGSFGGITFKALAASAPILTYLKHELLLQQYPEIPPVINCKSQADIMEALSYYHENRRELEDIGQKGRFWMKQYHNKSETVNIQLKQFGELLLPQVSQ